MSTECYSICWQIELQFKKKYVCKREIGYFILKKRKERLNKYSSQPRRDNQLWSWDLNPDLTRVQLFNS